MAKRMGRGGGRGSGGGEQQVSSAGHNVTDDTIKHHLDKIMPARDELEERQKEVSAARGAYRATLKAAKKDGIDPDAITAALKMMDGDSGAIKVRSAMTRRVLKVAGSPLAVIYSEQLSLDLDETGPKPAHSTGSDDVAHTDGYHKGRAGRNINENPHARTASAHKAWNAGWHEAQKDLAEEMGKKHDGAPGPAGEAKFHPNGAGAHDGQPAAA